MAKLEKAMHADDFYNNEENSKKVMFEHAELSKKLDQVMQDWESASEKLHKLED